MAQLLDNHTYMKWTERNVNSNKLFWSRLVAQLYNDPHGSTGFCRCLCPYGATALGYQDIFDSEIDHAKFSYDAFISYCKNDRLWVHDILMKELGNRYGFQLFIRYHDFPADAKNSKTIINKMSASREIVIILSDIALKSKRCQFELQQARTLSNQRRKPLIIVTLGDITKKGDIAKILDKHIYLKWADGDENSSKLFWDGLVDHLLNDSQSLQVIM
jgi:hypothetical protein